MTSTAKKVKKDTHIPRSIMLTMILAVVGGILLVRPYIGAILFSALIAYIFNPVYKSVLRKTKSNGLAILATLVAALLSVLIPLAFVVLVTVTQANSLINDVKSNTTSLSSQDIENITDNSVNRVNAIIRALPGGEGVQVSKEKLNESIRNAALDFLNLVVNFIKSIGLAFFGLISTSILVVFLVMAMLSYQDQILGMIRRISPYDDTLNKLYLSRAGTMTKAMVKGQVIIAICQGFAASVSLWIAGLDYFWFFVVFLSFMSFIPLGAGIITIPIGAVLILTGNVWQGIFIIVFHVTVVSFIDNILRPKLVPKDAALNTAVMLLAVFSGMALFGPAGIIFGPVLMILIQTTITVYGEYNKSVKRAELPDIKA